MPNAIEISNLSKIYRLGQIGTGTISHDLERWFRMHIRGQADPFLKIGKNNKPDKKNACDIIYSLRDINVEFKHGEVIGIIGRNGAGKSTLLKILSRITSPTTGKILIKGRVTSLLEVGTGFHPELTGRENIYLNGAILGMRKKEIERKFDEIVDFSGVERYIDTPVKRYSSGMYLRLAFAVAANLESEILIVDEVLAVGDMEFQKKCIGKMGEVRKKEGRTVLFVSHNMAAVRNLCPNGLVLQNGLIDYIGNLEECIKIYLQQNNKSMANPVQDVSSLKRKNGTLNAIKKVWIENKNNQPDLTFLMGEKMDFCFEFDLMQTYNKVIVGFGIEDMYGKRIFTLTNEILKGEYFNGVKNGVAKLSIIDNILLPGDYYLTVTIVSLSIGMIDSVHQAIGFFIEPADIYNTGKLPSSSQGIITSQGKISLENLC